MHVTVFPPGKTGPMLARKSSNIFEDDLNPVKCQQLIAFLTSHLQLGFGSTQESQQGEEQSVSCFHGTILSFSSLLHTDWVLDTG